MIPGDEFEPNHPYAAMLIILGILLMALFFSGCTTTRYIPVETTHTDSIYITRTTRDSIHTTDSIYIYVKGDTITRDRYHKEYIFLTRTDTAYINRIDTVNVPYPVEAELSRAQKTWIQVGQIAAMLLAVGLLILAGYILISRLM